MGAIRELAIISLTIRTGVISNYILNVTCGNGADGYISFAVAILLTKIGNQSQKNGKVNRESISRHTKSEK
jgi:hypothetical protein